MGGGTMCSVSLRQFSLRWRRSTVRRGVPSGLHTTCMRACHLVFVPTGTFSIVPSATSSSSWAFTASRRCSGPVLAVIAATGLASGSLWILIGSQFIIGRLTCGHLLNADEAYLSIIQDFIFSTFSTTGPTTDGPDGG